MQTKPSPVKGVHWNLDDILKPDQFDALYADLQSRLKHFPAFFSQLKPDMAVSRFATFMDFSEKLSEDYARLYDLGALLEATDHTDTQAKLMKSRAKDLGVKIDEASRSIQHWIKGMNVDGKKSLDDNNAVRLFAAVPKLRYVLERSRLAAKHTLSEPEERIIAQKDANGISTLLDLRTVLETEQTFSFKPPRFKKPKLIKTQAELLSHVVSIHPELRRAAYDALLGKYRQNLQKFFMIYEAVVKNWDQEASNRSFVQPISARNFDNDISDSTVQTLLEVCRENRLLFQEFFKYKARKLKLRKLSRYDLYAPVVREPAIKITFPEAEKIVLQTLSAFDDTFGAHARQILDVKHVDSHPSPLKQGGAFCATVGPAIAPYVLLNYTNRMRDVMVLAHELGHGVHSLYASGQSISAQHAGLPLSETASTFAEMLVFDALLKRTKTDSQRRVLLVDKLADTYATIMRQNYFVLFEIEAHKLIAKGATADDLSSLYLSQLREQFGNSVSIPALFRYEWSYIPHIVHTPFYCYAYNFGELLSLSLYAQYKKEGLSYTAKIGKILAAGGSANPETLLSSIGIDISSRAFWEGSFQLVREWIKELQILG